MRKIIAVLGVIAFSLASCSSSDGGSDAVSSIMIDNVAFTPTTAKVSHTASDYDGQTAMVFTLEKGTGTSDNHQVLTFRINYPLNSSNAPNGVYDFGIGVIGEMLFASGDYIKGQDYFGMAGYTVKVTALGNNKYKLEFQNVQAISMITQDEVIISGSYEGTFQAL